MARRYIRDAQGRFAEVPEVKTVNRREPNYIGNTRVASSFTNHKTYRAQGHPAEFRRKGDADVHAQEIARSILKGDPNDQLLRGFQGNKTIYNSDPNKPPITVPAKVDKIIDKDNEAEDLEILADDREEIGARLDTFVHGNQNGAATDAEITAVQADIRRRLSEHEAATKKLNKIVDKDNLTEDLDILASDKEEVGARLDTFVHGNKNGAATDAEIAAVQAEAKRQLQSKPGNTSRNKNTTNFAAADQTGATGLSQAQLDKRADLDRRQQSDATIAREIKRLETKGPSRYEDSTTIGKWKTVQGERAKMTPAQRQEDRINARTETHLAANPALSRAEARKRAESDVGAAHTSKAPQAPTSDPLKDFAAGARDPLAAKAAARAEAKRERARARREAGGSAEARNIAKGLRQGERSRERELKSDGLLSNEEIKAIARREAKRARAAARRAKARGN